MMLESDSSASKRHAQSTLDDPLALESQVCFALAVASRAVIGAYRSVLEPIQLTHPQYLVMLALWQHERLTIRQIAELLRLESATVSPLVKRLEAVGYVRKRRSDRDERIVEVALTPTGLRLREAAEHIPGQMMAKLGMDEPGLRELHAVMMRIIASVDAAAEAEAEAEAEADAEADADQ